MSKIDLAAILRSIDEAIDEELGPEKIQVTYSFKGSGRVKTVTVHAKTEDQAKAIIRRMVDVGSWLKFEKIS